MKKHLFQSKIWSISQATLRQGCNQPGACVATSLAIDYNYLKYIKPPNT